MDGKVICKQEMLMKSIPCLIKHALISIERLVYSCHINYLLTKFIFDYNVSGTLETAQKFV